MPPHSLFNESVEEFEERELRIFPKLHIIGKSVRWAEGLKGRIHYDEAHSFNLVGRYPKVVDCDR